MPNKLFAKLKSLFCLSTAFFSCAVVAQANNVIGDVDRQNQAIERQLQEHLREEQERAQSIQRDRRALPAFKDADLQEQESQQIGVPSMDVPCQKIREIRFIGNTSRLPDDLKRSIQSNGSGRCMGKAELEGVLSLVTKSYVDRGYITTRAYLAEQDLSTGVLEVTVVEGKIERFEVVGTSERAQWVGGAFPVGSGDLLNLYDLEQGIDQINSLTSNRAKLNLKPGGSPGQTVVLVENPSTFPLHLYTSFDNSGVPATGRNNASVTVSADSLLGLNELLLITRRESLFGSEDHKSESTGLRVAMPWGYNTLSMDVNKSRNTNVLNTPSGLRLRSEGITTTHGLMVDRVMYRNQAGRISLSARVNTQSTRNWLGGQFLQVSSRNLSMLDVGASVFTRLGGGMFNTRLGYVKGLKIFGALQDSDALDADLPHAQFRKATLDLGYSRRFEIANHAFLLSSQFSGQHALDTLYGSQQILIGGISSVRGFLNTVLSGDSGAYLRNELSIPWQHDGSLPLQGRLYAGYDLGRVSNKAQGVPSGSLSGATLGVATQWQSLNLDIFASRAVHVPNKLKSEGTLVFFRLSLSF